MEVLNAKGGIPVRDIETVYEALFLRAVTGFEQFCATLFEGCDRTCGAI